MLYKKIDENDLQQFRSLLGAEGMSVAAPDLAQCASDHTEDFVFYPEVVLRPQSTAEVSAVLAYCNQHNIPVTARGAGTGLSGGALPVAGGVSLDMKRMNRILNIDTQNFQVTTEPGVITEVLQNAVKEKGLYYPPDPASKGSCFIGGNIAENSGGPRAVKYGVVKDFVLNLEVVLADGSVMWTGANVLKNATGYNLTQLVVGSEGTLCIVTKIVLRLIPANRHDLLLLIPFHDASEACRAVNDIFLAGITPSALEFMERDALECAVHYFGDSSVPLPDHVQAHLLVEVDGNHPEQLIEEAEQITAIAEKYATDPVLFADTAAQKQQLWKLRRIVGEAVKGNSIYKEEDTVVPRACLPELLQHVKETGKKYGFRSVCYGHAGDGNLHVNIVKGDMSDHDWQYKLPEGIRELFGKVHQMGGTISGEHGIGYVQKTYLSIVFNATQLALMEAIKKAFDPKGILNPGKIFA
ncbi:FAD-binding oxidoreductase [Rurimicrobium arvi]|uniref:FAD-linked oxidase C-terminal domain-containing protein n=1 Tax=Rurimicrobium arvi TaxID=2049916 RepID=A0ABP8MV62_9BACT